MIFEILVNGPENAITGKQIAEIFGIDVRDVTQIVERERREGKPICASVHEPRGYYLASNRAEMEDYCRTLRKRGGELFKTYRALKSTAEKLPD